MLAALAPNPDYSQQMPLERLLIRARHGQFMVLAEDQVIAPMLAHYGEAYELTWLFLRRFLSYGQVIADVGANFGAFTLPFATAVGPYGKVIALEPQPAIFNCLRETLALNQMPQVDLYSACAGARNETLEIAEPDYNQPGDFGSVSFADHGDGNVMFQPSRIRVPCFTLDSVIKGGRLSFLKIDVEGMALDVLKGADETLKRCKPVLFIGSNRAETTPAVVHFLQERGYRMWWHMAPLFNHDNHIGKLENIYGLRLELNMICLPPGMSTVDIPPSLEPVTEFGNLPSENKLL
jgi:FkbM family methyltransferase